MCFRLKSTYLSDKRLGDKTVKSKDIGDIRIGGLATQEIQEMAKYALSANKNLSNMLSDLPRLVPTFKKPIPDGLLNEIGTLWTLNREAASKLIEPLAGISSINTAAFMKLDPLFNMGAGYKVIAQAINEYSRKALAAQQAMARTLAELWDKVKSDLAFLNEEEFNEFEYNWLLFLPIPKMREFYQQWKDGKVADIDKFFRDGFSEDEAIDELLNVFNDNELFKPRINIIEDALGAHLARKYTLSIPVILTQIDGIFIERYKILEGELSYTCPKCGHRREMQLNARNISEHLASRESVYLGWFLRHIIDTFDKLRNDILHGKKLNYPDADLSTKLVLTLFQLHHSVQHPVKDEILNDALEAS